MGRRHQLDVCADILRVTRAGARKTRIVYGANLNFDIVKVYLGKLLRAQMLTFTEDPLTFTTTDKGIRFLNTYETMVTPLM